MTRNQKIALGCGGAGCLGLIVVVIAACAIYFLSRGSTNSNINSNTNLNTNSSVPSVSEDDDKHRLYQAARMTGDEELIRRVEVKIGILNEDFTPGEKYQQFVADHISWTIKNRDFIQTISTPEKARAYVNDHFPE